MRFTIINLAIITDNEEPIGKLIFCVKNLSLQKLEDRRNCTISRRSFFGIKTLSNNISIFSICYDTCIMGQHSLNYNEGRSFKDRLQRLWRHIHSPNGDFFCLYVFVKISDVNTIKGGCALSTHFLNKNHTFDLDNDQILSRIANWEF